MSSLTNTCLTKTKVEAAAAAAAAVVAPPPQPRVLTNPSKGIVSILGLDCDQRHRASPPSIRRTLSADISSKNIAGAAFSSSSSEEEEFNGQDEVWKSIQAQKMVNDDEKQPIRSINSWSAILSSQKTQFPPPYIHPLVKKPSLSKQSLEICTESLCSESGDNKEETLEHLQQHININYIKKSSLSSSPPPSFPPLLPSLAANSSVQLRSHRQGGGGRLILEAVSVPQRNYFHAERSDGRLLLTAHNSTYSEDEIEEDDNNSDEDEEEEEISQNYYWKKSITTPMFRGCKESRRPQLIWHTNYCVATS